jgi:hypothetical protein
LAPYGRVAAGGAKAAARLSGPLRPLNAIAVQAHGILGDIDGLVSTAQIVAHDAETVTGGACSSLPRSVAFPVPWIAAPSSGNVWSTTSAEHRNDPAPETLTPTVEDEFYAQGDYHRVYFGEIVAVYADEDAAGRLRGRDVGEAGRRNRPQYGSLDRWHPDRSHMPFVDAQPGRRW